MNLYLIKIPLNSYIIISVKRDKRFDILHTAFLIRDLSRSDVALQSNEDLWRRSEGVMNATGVEDLTKYQFLRPIDEFVYSFFLRKVISFYHGLFSC